MAATSGSMNGWEELNRPRTERSTPPPPLAEHAVSSADPTPEAADKPFPVIGDNDPFLILGVCAAGFVGLTAAFMVLGSLFGSPTAGNGSPDGSTTRSEPASLAFVPPTTRSVVESEATSSTATGIAAAQDDPVLAPKNLTENEAAVLRLYLLVFGREPDASGLDYWTNQLSDGAPMVALAEQFVSTREFIEIYGQNPTQAELVDMAHLRVLDRLPTDEERAFWDGLGIDGIEFLIAFSNSPQAREALGTS